MNQLTRPALGPELTGTELRRWYWLRSELAGLARTLGISPAGSKVELTERLSAALDGNASAPATRARVAAGQLSGPLADHTVIPPGQRCSQLLRRYFETRIGPGFRFDQSMRAFIGAGADQTLDDAVRHWRATRSTGPREIAPQFELNRFTRDWYRDHPGGSRADLVAAWRSHRSRPVEMR